MAFTVEDFHDLIELLAQRPEWRAELRRHVLSDELLELPALVRQLVEAQARAEARLESVESAVIALTLAQGRTEARLEELAEAQIRAEARLERVEVRLEGVETRIGGLESAIQTLVEAQARTEAQMAELVAAQARGEARQSRAEDRLGRLDGRMLEFEFARNAMAYLGTVVRRARVVEKSALAEWIDDAMDEGRFSQMEREAILLADLIVAGRRPADGRDVYVLAEVSVGVGPRDVDRAADRAALLERLGRPVLPVVAGEQINTEAQALAQVRGVQYVRVTQ